MDKNKQEECKHDGEWERKRWGWVCLECFRPIESPIPERKINNLKNLYP